MAEKIIAIADHRYRATLPAIPTTLGEPNGSLVDRLERPLHDLRISVTDRCNFRCSYCMPKEVFDKGYAFLPQSSLLSFEEITRVARLFVAHGVRKIRLTGGEPLLRRDLERLIAMLAELRCADGGPLDLTLTTNGSLLARKAAALRSAGLGRVTVSLDALDDAVFRAMNDADFPVADVLRGIEAAERAGLGPIKVNMVVKRGTNDQEILPMARHFRGTSVTLRFIEYMDVGATNGWRMDEVLPSAEVIRRIDAEFALERLPGSASGETAERWRYAEPGCAEAKSDVTGAEPHAAGAEPDFAGAEPSVTAAELAVTPPRVGSAGEIGTISSVSKAFCGDCNRARLSTEGKLFLCLFASRGHDLRGLLRGGAGDREISAAIGAVWQGRSDRYSELRSLGQTVSASGEQRVEMHYIGG